MMGRTRRAVVTGGMALLVGAPLAWAATLPPRDVGLRPGAEVLEAVAGGGPAAPAAPAAAPVLAGTEPAAPPAAPTPAAAPWTTTAPTGAIDPGRWPVELRIPTLGVTAPVEPVGLEADGDVAIPDSPRTVGWFRGAAVPGDDGTAVLASHVDSRREGLGVLAELRRLAVGDPIEVVAADGTTAAWTVVAREQVAKEDLPSGRLFALGGAPALALVTCGGRFDVEARSYADNVIVWAVPAG
jgi:sortase (surface protein transpeptidase)